jgi:hypothetical protein
MQELRFVAVSEDGSYAVLAVPGRSGRYILPIDERLRAVAQGQTSRLAQYEIEVESPLRPKEIQARIRAGETAEEIADAAGIPVERVRWFEGPVLAERAYIADQAQAGSVRRAGDSPGPGPRLGDIVTARLSAAGTDPADGQWDSRKRGDGNWQVSLTFPSGGRLHVAEWVFDPRRRHVMPDDDNAARLSLPESELPAEPVPMPGEATVTPIASRLGAAAGMGVSAVGGPGVSRFRPDRSVIPDRSLGVDRSLAERPMPPSAPAPDRAAMSDRAAVSDRSTAPERSAMSPAPVPPRHSQQDRPGYQGRPANPGYAEFPESAPYRAPDIAPEPSAYRGQAPEPAAYRTAEAEPPTYRAPEAGFRGNGDPASVSPAYRPQAEPPTYREAAPEPRTYRDPAPETAQPPAFGDPTPEPAARRAPAAGDLAADQIQAAQVSRASAFEDPERGRLTPPRPVIFEDPQPTFLGEQPEMPLDSAPARPAPTAPPATRPTPVPEPVAAAPARKPEPQAPRLAEATSAATAAEVPAPAVGQAAAPGTVPPASPAVAVPTKTQDTPVTATTVTQAPAATETTTAPWLIAATQAEVREPETVPAQTELFAATAIPPSVEPRVTATTPTPQPADGSRRGLGCG